MSKQELNPCPRCGGRNVEWTWDFNQTVFEARDGYDMAIVCRDCKTRSFGHSEWGYAQAADEWNRGDVR